MKKIVIYTPTYFQSPGTRYKVDMMKKALENKFNVKIIADKREGALRTVYNYLGPILLRYDFFWKQMGRIMANRIIHENPDVAILVIDITASAIPYLKKNDIKVILSVEDLSWEWLNIQNQRAIKTKFKKYSQMSDKVITISESVQKKLLEFNIESTVVPPGLDKIYVTNEQASISLQDEVSLLHAGKIQHEDEVLAFSRIAEKLHGKYAIRAYESGKYSNLLKKKFPWIDWYNFPTAEEAVNDLKSCRVGLIIRYRAHNPGRIYYHASMLQPIIAVGDMWTNEVARNKIGVVIDPDNIEEAITKILNNYDRYLDYVKKYAEENILNNAYANLINYILTIK